MTRILSAITTLALVASLGSGAFAKDKDKMHRGASSHASTMGRTMSSRCTPGKKWVHGYRRKDGTMVKGYCR